MCLIAAMTIQLENRSPRRADWLRMIMAVVLGVAFLVPGREGAAEQPLSRRMADATIERWPNGRFLPAEEPWHWNYELGTLLEGMDAVWYNTAVRSYYQYIKDSVDPLVAADGGISTYEQSANSLDNVLLGRQ